MVTQHGGRDQRHSAHNVPQARIIREFVVRQMAAQGQERQTRSEHNKSAFGCIATKRSLTEGVEAICQAVNQAPRPKGPYHALGTYRRHENRLAGKLYLAVATRYDQPAANYLAFVQLASACVNWAIDL